MGNRQVVDCQTLSDEATRDGEGIGKVLDAEPGALRTRHAWRSDHQQFRNAQALDALPHLVGQRAG
jgi:hypothetical protein